MASRATALLATQSMYKIDHGVIHDALVKVKNTANHNLSVFTKDNAVTKSVVERYTVRATGILGSFEAQRDRKLVPEV